MKIKRETLEPGKCYEVEFKNHLLKSHFDKEQFNEQLRICTSSCSDCNQNGVEDCLEEEKTCACIHPYSGSTCDECVSGYFFEPDSR